MEQQLQLEHMSEFISVADAGSMTAAADRTFLAQPVLSKHIKGIEAELGARLLVRSHSGVSLSSAGEDVYNSFREITAIYNSLRQRIREQKGEVGLLKIGMLNLGVGRYVIPTTMKYQELHPKAEVRYSTEKPNKLLENLLAGTLDIAFLGGDLRLQKEGLTFLRIRDEEIFFLISRKNLGAITDTITSTALSGHPLICLRNQPSTEFMNSIILQSGIVPSTVIGVDELELVPTAIVESSGFFAVPEFMLEKFNTCTEIFTVRYTPKLTMQVSFVYNNENTNPALTGFLEAANQIKAEYS